MGLFYFIHTYQDVSLYASDKTQISNPLSRINLSLISPQISEVTDSFRTNITNLSNNEGHSEAPQLAAYRNYLYLVWMDDTSGNRDIYLRRSTDHGATFNEAINLSNSSGGSSDPQVIASENNVYVVWESTPGNNGEILFTRSTDYGITFEKASNIGNNSGFSGFPQVATSGSNVYLVWHDASNGIFFKRSTDNGVSFKKAITLTKNDTLSFHPQIVTVSGNLYIVWIKPSKVMESTYNIIFRRSTDNGISFEKPITIGKRDRLSSHLQIVGAPGTNNLYVVWYNGTVVTTIAPTRITDIIFTRSIDNGASFERPIVLSNYTGWSINPQIAVSQNDSVYVVWESNTQERNGEIIFSKSTNNGARFEKPRVLSINSSDSSYPQIAVSQNDSVYVVWEENGTRNKEVIFLKSALNNDTGLEHSSQVTTLGNATSVDSKYHETINVAVVHPTFTDAAYDKSFYIFFNGKGEGLDISRDRNNTKYTNFLSSDLNKHKPRQWSVSETTLVIEHLKRLSPQFNVTLLTDVDVHNNISLFAEKGTNKYDIIILGHQEYVTQQEYDNLKQFVENGGLMILLNGNVFYAEVKYDMERNKITLVKGHEWAFNGKQATKSVSERWANETSEWVGSNYCRCYRDIIGYSNNPFDYTHNEEQYITNPNAKILLNYNATVFYDDPRSTGPSKMTVATYELNYKKGKVITIGLTTSEQLLKNDRFKRFLDSILLQNANEIIKER